MKKLLLHAVIIGTVIGAAESSYARECSVPELFKELVAINRALAERVKNLEGRVDKLELEVNRLRSEVRKSGTEAEKERQRAVRKKGAIFEVAAYGHLTPKATKEMWRVIEKLRSTGIPASVKRTRKYVLILAYVKPEKEKTLKFLYPDAFKLRKVENPDEVFKKLPVLNSYEDLLYYLATGSVGG